jgi:hypothetical protein
MKVTEENRDNNPEIYIYIYKYIFFKFEYSILVRKISHCTDLLVSVHCCEAYFQFPTDSLSDKLLIRVYFQTVDIRQKYLLLGCYK